MGTGVVWPALHNHGKHQYGIGMDKRLVQPGTKAVMYFGPKEGCFNCAELNYTPTPEQIAHIKEYFGWYVELVDE